MSNLRRRYKISKFASVNYPGRITNLRECLIIEDKSLNFRMDNKTLIDKVSASVGLDRNETQRVLNDFYDIVAQCCVEQDAVIIPGFGQFEPKKRKERLTVHPSTGKRLLVPPKLVVGFRPSGVMKAKVQ